MKQKSKRKQAEKEKSENLDYHRCMESVDRIIRQATGLDDMLENILSKILQIYDCDRVFLYYPCDPESKTWRIPIMMAKPQFADESMLQKDIPMLPEYIKVFSAACETEDVLCYSENEIQDLPKQIKSFGAKSVMFKTLHPKNNKSWLLGMHQCSHEKLWSENEKLIFVEIAGRLANAIGTMTVIRNLSESEERFRRITENAKDMIFRMSLPEGTYDYVSSASVDISGYTPEEIYNNPKWIAQTIHPDWKEYFRDEWEKLLHGDMPPFYEYKIIHRNGEERWLNQRNALVKDENGTPIAIEGIVTDITKRKKVESALKEERDKAQLFLDIAGVMMIAIDHNQIVTLANEKSQEILECEEKEIIGNNWFDSFLLSQDIDLVKDIFNKIMRGEIEAAEYYENPVLSKSGKTKLIAWHNTVIRDENGNITHTLSSGEDITERKRAEEALQASEKRYKELTELLPQIVFEIDLDGELIYTNRYSFQMTGYTEKDMEAGLYAFDLIAPEHINRLKKNLAEMLDNGYSGGNEYVLIKKDGSRIPVIIYSSAIYDGSVPIGYRGIIIDITERKQYEESLKDIIVGVSSNIGELFFDSLMKQLLKILRAEFTYIGKIVSQKNNVITTISTCDRGELVDNLQYDLRGSPGKQAIETGLLSIASGLESQFPDDDLIRSRHFEGFVGVRLMDSYNQTIGLIAAYFKDPIENSEFVESILQIFAGRTAAEMERLRAEEDRSRIEEQLRQSQKMESIGKLAGGIAHDFNNILTSILGNCDLAISDLRPEDPLYLELSEITRGAERAADLTKQLLAFSRKQVLEPKILDLNSIIADMDKMLRRIIGEDIILNTNFFTELWKIKVDPGQMEQVILNLAVNARDAMPNGGRLLLETNNIILDREYANGHPDVTQGEYVMLAMSDTGSGIGKEIQASIFDPFFTTKEVGKGTGLGLSTVYGIVKQSGGNIWVYSEIDKGTTFKIYLPKAIGDKEEPSISDLDVIPPQGTENILIVEDDNAVRMMTVKVLKQLGYKVFDAQNGGEALLICETLEKPVDLIVTDVVMPKMSGVEFVERIRKMWNGVKALYISGYTPNYIIHEGVLDPEIPYLQKPFRPNSFAEKIREVLDNK